MDSGNIIFGRNPVQEALKNRPESLEKIYIRYGVQGSAIEEIQRLARKAKIPISFLDREKFKRIAQNFKIEDTQGVVAYLNLIKYTALEDLLRQSFEKTKLPILVILDRIQDPQNLGAIARTAECSGAQGLVLPAANSAPITPTVVKASAGAILAIPIAKVQNLGRTIDRLKENGFWIVGTSANVEKTFWEIRYDFPVGIVIGNEGKGIGPSIQKKCDFVVRIPLFGKTESLNASVSAGIILYEVLRQRGLSVQE